MVELTSPYRGRPRHKYDGPTVDEFEVGLEEALRVQVRHGRGRDRVCRTLEWLVQNDPAYLDMLMDRVQPGMIKDLKSGRLFAALTTVCSEYADVIGNAVLGRCTRLRSTNPGTGKRHQVPQRLMLRPEVVSEIDRESFAGSN